MTLGECLNCKQRVRLEDMVQDQNYCGMDCAIEAEAKKEPLVLPHLKKLMMLDIEIDDLLTDEVKTEKYVPTLVSIIEAMYFSLKTVSSETHSVKVGSRVPTLGALEAMRGLTRANAIAERISR